MGIDRWAIVSFLVIVCISFVSANCVDYYWKKPMIAQASSFESGFGVEKAIDSDARTHWKSKEGSYPHWISFDLVNDSCVKGIELFVFKSYGPISAMIQISGNGKDWINYSDKEIVIPNGTYRNFSFEEALTRYVRVYETSGVKEFGSLSEIRVLAGRINGSTVFINSWSIRGNRYLGEPKKADVVRQGMLGSNNVKLTSIGGDNLINDISGKNHGIDMKEKISIAGSNKNVRTMSETEKREILLKYKQQRKIDKN